MLSVEKSRKVDNDASRIRKKIRKSPKDESLREKVLKADFQKSIVSSGNEEKTLNHIEFNFNDPVNSRYFIIHNPLFLY